MAPLSERPVAGKWLSTRIRSDRKRYCTTRWIRLSSSTCRSRSRLVDREAPRTRPSSNRRTGETETEKEHTFRLMLMLGFQLIIIITCLSAKWIVERAADGQRESPDATATLQWSTTVESGEEVGQLIFFVFFCRFCFYSEHWSFTRSFTRLSFKIWGVNTAHFSFFNYCYRLFTIIIVFLLFLKRNAKVAKSEES